jgi:hypothetical protein
MQIFIRIRQGSTLVVHVESSDSTELLQRLVCTDVDKISEEHQQLSFWGRQLPRGVQLKDYGICDGSTLQLDALLQGGKDVHDEDNESALPELHLTHYPGSPSGPSPSQCAVEGHTAIVHRISPPNSSSLMEQTFANSMNSGIAMNLGFGNAAAAPDSPAEAASMPASACAMIPLCGGAAHVAVVPIGGASGVG